jgi:hypothetical protein
VSLPSRLDAIERFNSLFKVFFQDEKLTMDAFLFPSENWDLLK